MDQELKDEWAQAINDIMEMDSHKRRHFALLLISLAKCYTKSEEWMAVILIKNPEALLTFSAGADEAEAAEMLKVANETFLLAATADAPPKEMFN